MVVGEIVIYDLAGPALRWRLGEAPEVALAQGGSKGNIVLRLDRSELIPLAERLSDSLVSIAGSRLAEGRRFPDVGAATIILDRGKNKLRANYRQHLNKKGVDVQVSFKQDTLDHLAKAVGLHVQGVWEDST